MQVSVRTCRSYFPFLIVAVHRGQRVLVGAGSDGNGKAKERGDAVIVQMSTHPCHS